MGVVADGAENRGGGISGCGRGLLLLHREVNPQAKQDVLVVSPALP